RMVRAALPFLQEKVNSYQAYAEASVEEIYGPRLKAMRLVEVNTTASMVFFNRGDRFEAVPLPAEAQWAPAFGVCVADVGGAGAGVRATEGSDARSPWGQRLLVARWSDADPGEERDAERLMGALARRQGGELSVSGRRAAG